MKRLPLFVLTFLVALIAGLPFVWISIRNRVAAEPQESNTSGNTLQKPTYLSRQNNIPEPPSADEYKEALGDIWITSDRYKVGDYVIRRSCQAESEKCGLLIKRNGKTLGRFEITDANKHWLRYGFFNFLGKKEKQLVVHKYSGGAHCCYDYTIYDLEPKFRIVYSSASFDSANEIGDELVPIDIDKDGVYEFYQDVMAFDYMAEGGHATASFPPAIFRFDKNQGEFILTNRRFPDYVLQKLNQNIEGLDHWRRDNEKSGSRIDDEEMNEIRVRETFLYLVYAGKRDEGWEYFQKNYRSETGNQYQDQFRDKFIKDFRQLFAKDPTYRSIYEQ